MLFTTAAQCYHRQLPGHGKYPASKAMAWPGLGRGPSLQFGTLLHILPCPERHPGFSPLSSRAMPSVSAAKRTIPPPTSPIPNFDSDSASASARTETDLTSTRTIDARHRRRHAYLTPRTKHIPVKVRQTRQYTQTNQPPAPPQVRLSLPKTDLPAIPQDSALSPRQAALPGQGTVQAPSMPAQRNSASLPSPSVARGAGAHHDRLIPCGRLSRGPIPSHPQSARLFDRAQRRVAVHSVSIMHSTRAVQGRM
ncbi:hypothetical protein V492_00048 [Pseudogymnoascus sp. VKM F-4246]|nr:hypothetical protein V492_00048 [Pseudogymnoascus sp. VKM F-4246]